MPSIRRTLLKLGGKSDGKLSRSPSSAAGSASPTHPTIIPPPEPTPIQASIDATSQLPLSVDSSSTSQTSIRTTYQSSTIQLSGLPSQHQEVEPESGTGTAPTPPDAIGNKAFEAAVQRISQGLEASERRNFLDAYSKITPEETLQTIKQLDETDGRNLARRGARSLGQAIQVLEQFMAGVAIGIQQSPEISSLVVGGVRLLISLVAKFVEFYVKLSDMICSLTDYLAPLKGFSNSGCDGSVIQEALIGIYGDLMTFLHEARLVFVNEDGTIRRLGTFRTFFRVQWQPFDAKFGGIKARFEHHLNVLQTAAQAKQLDMLSTGFKEADVERKRIQSKEQIEERRAFLEWISNVNHEGDFDRIIKQRHPRTGIWLLEHTGFKQWKDEPHSSLLWCYGNPGAGKSVLASVALDHLTKYELEEEKTCVLFAYYSYRHPERDNPSSLVASFIKQLCSKLDFLPEKAHDFYKSHFYNARIPTFEDMEPLLSSLLEIYSKAFVVIDALDECQAPTQESRKQSSQIRPRYRQEVLDFLGSLISKDLFSVKVLVTSRREDDISDAFSRRPVIEIDAAQVDADIKTYLLDELDLRTKRGSLKLRDPNLKEQIFSTLSSRAHGMFLWVRLQLDWICEQKGDEDILEELGKLPEDLCETYDRILERLSLQPPRLREIARRALMWVLYALRPIEIEELREAIAIEPSIKSHKALKEKIREEDVIISCTGGLLLVEKLYPRIVRPIHTSVQEYLTQTSEDDSKSHVIDFSFCAKLAHRQLAESCMVYLQLDIFEKGPLLHQFYLRNRLGTAALACYSASFFDNHISHLKGLPQEIQTSLDLFLSSEKRNLAAVLQCRRHSVFSTFSSGVNAATIVYSTDLYNLLQSYRPECEWLSLEPPRYCLHQAATNDSTDAMQRLVDLGQSIYELDEDGTAPLYHSAIEGRLSSCKWLLEHGADVSLQGGVYNTALQAASTYGHLAIVELLLKHNADVNLQGGHHNTALQAASTCGHLAIVELLLKHNADVNLQGGEDNTALQATSTRGDLAIVELLLKHNADVNLQGGRYNTALQGASTYGHLAIVELLLKHNADVNLQGGHHNTALQAASARGDLAIVELLLKHGSKVTSGSLEAACGGYCSGDNVAYLLLENGAKVTTKALENASKYGWKSRYQTLLDFQKKQNEQVVERIEEVCMSIKTLFEVHDKI